jgi:hypothetical protein
MRQCGGFANGPGERSLVQDVARNGESPGTSERDPDANAERVTVDVGVPHALEAV